MRAQRKKRVLIAKPGLDGHDRGARVVAFGLRQAGVEVVYSGLHQTGEAIVNVALQEDVDLIGLSILSGSHLGLTRKVVDRMAQAGVWEKKLVVGGVIPAEDVPVLKQMGVAEVYPVGSDINAVIAGVLRILSEDGTVAGGRGDEPG